MANHYDPLIDYLAKNKECTLDTALTLLNKYKDDQSRYTTITRLCQRKILKRERRGTTTWIMLVVTPVKFVAKAEKPAESDVTLDQIAQIYRFVVRYGAQHYAVPGRANINAVLKEWIGQRRDLIQFLNLLVDLVDNDATSHLEYQELEAGLKVGGWYGSDWDAYDGVLSFIDLVNPKGEGGCLGISEEDWLSLSDPQNLRRINPK